MKEATLDVRYYLLDRSIKTLAERGMTLKVLPYTAPNSPASPKELFAFGAARQMQMANKQ